MWCNDSLEITNDIQKKKSGFHDLKSGWVAIKNFLSAYLCGSSCYVSTTINPSHAWHILQWKCDMQSMKKHFLVGRHYQCIPSGCLPSGLEFILFPLTNVAKKGTSTGNFRNFGRPFRTFGTLLRTFVNSLWVIFWRFCSRLSEDCSKCPEIPLLVISKLSKDHSKHLEHPSEHLEWSSKSSEITSYTFVDYTLEELMPSWMKFISIFIPRIWLRRALFEIIAESSYTRSMLNKLSAISE